MAAAGASHPHSALLAGAPSFLSGSLHDQRVREMRSRTRRAYKRARGAGNTSRCVLDNMLANRAPHRHSSSATTRSIAVMCEKGFR